MAVNPLAGALRALGSPPAQAAPSSQAGAFGAIGKDFEFLMKALGSTGAGGNALDALTQAFQVAPAAPSRPQAQPESASRLRFESGSAGIASAASQASPPQVSPLQAMRFIDAVTAPVASVGKNLSVIA